MLFRKHPLAIAMFTFISPFAFANEQTNVQKLETIQVQAQESQANFATQQVEKEQLMKGSVTIGNALDNELGVYTNEFGGGSSYPVIRGQDSARVKIVENGSDLTDVATLSPDHAVSVDPVLAKEVKIIRGPETLLYSAGSVGGTVDVKDGRIPEAMPKNEYEGSVMARYNSGSDERLGSLETTVALGDQFALRLEALKRHANDYIAPSGYEERRVDNTFAKDQTLNLGLSWIYDRGFVGMSYSNRQNQYGLPGHSHEYHDCHVHGLSLHCGAHGAHPGHGTGAHSDEDNPWIDLKSERYDVRSELRQPFTGFDALRAQASYTRYKHDELEGNEPITNFKNDGYTARLELDHQEWGAWSGTIGAQYVQQKIDITGDEAFLDLNKTKKWSLFAIEKANFNQVDYEVSARYDHQKINIDNTQLKDFNGGAFSAAAGASWEFIPNYTLSFTASHQERLPLPQELYANGVHFATNTYELGTDSLKKEKSNNLELGFAYNQDRLNYSMSVYHNWFNNYIYADTLDQEENFRLVKYSQDKARFYGTEAQLSYAFTEQYTWTVFGDYVRGKIDNQNAPRIPSGRLGTRFNVLVDDHWSGSAEYFHVFKQNKIADYETKTAGYNMLNLGLNYTDQINAKNSYTVFLEANNLLNDQVYQHASFLSTIPQVGRNFTVGVNFNF